MQKNNVRDYSFSILLCVSFLIAGVIWILGELKIQESQNVSETYADDGVAEEETEGIGIPDNLGIIEESTECVTVEEMPEEISSVEETIEENTPQMYTADISYLDDALFIGDSRTVGLYEYGGLGNAEVFADSGMSIYKVFNEKFALKSGETVTLDEALLAKEFGKIYIMLGINELGYDFEQTVERFAEAIDTIRTYQPQAYIFIQANLHITKEKSEKSEYFTNSNIDRYNKAISELADGEQIFYLDVNPLYDDEEGCLSKEFTADHAHIKGKHYTEWVDFILQNAVRRE